MANTKNSYLYFPGCTMKATGAAYGESVLTLFRLLGLQLDELDDWNCCGATTYMSIDERAAFVLSGRNLSLAHQAGPRDLVVPCSACFLILRKTQEYVRQYPALRQEVEGALKQAGLPPMGPVRVRHPLDVLYTDIGVDQIRAKVTRRWQGGKVACYYGCQALRPYAEADQAHNPMRMDQLLQAVGVTTVDYPLKTKCCGGSLTGTIHPVGARLNEILLKESVRKGAQAVATMCPLCQFNLDAYQSEMHESGHEPWDIPVLYFTQILGWALGGDFRALGLQRSIAGRDAIGQWFAAPKEVEAYA
jgi:heterodisulfide reductase subunit B